MSPVRPAVRWIALIGTFVVLVLGTGVGVVLWRYPPKPAVERPVAFASPVDDLLLERIDGFELAPPGPYNRSLDRAATTALFAELGVSQGPASDARFEAAAMRTFTAASTGESVIVIGYRYSDVFAPDATLADIRDGFLRGGSAITLDGLDWYVAASGRTPEGNQLMQVAFVRDRHIFHLILGQTGTDDALTRERSIVAAQYARTTTVAPPPTVDDYREVRRPYGGVPAVSALVCAVVLGLHAIRLWRRDHTSKASPLEIDGIDAAELGG